MIKRLLLLVLLFASQAAEAVYTHIQTTIQSPSAATRALGAVSISETFGSTPTIGNLAIIYVSEIDLSFGGASLINSIADNYGNTWQIFDQAYDNGQSMGIAIGWTIVVTTGASFTVTVGTTGAEDMVIGISEYSGNHATSPYDNSIPLVGGATPADCTTIQPTVEGDLFLTAITHNGTLNATFTTPIGFSNRAINGSGASGPIMASASKIATATPTFRSSGAGANGTSSLAMGAPAGVQTTDVVLAVLSFNLGTGMTITPPTGWTLANRVNSTTVYGQAVYWALGTVASYTFTITNSNTTAVGYAVAYRGVNTTTPMDATAVGQTNASSTTVTAPTITTVTANAMLVGFFGSYDLAGGAAPTFSAFMGGSGTEHGPSGAAAGVGYSFFSAPNGDRITIDTAELVQASAGASGSKTTTISVAHTNVGQLIALRPLALAAEQPIWAWTGSTLASWACLSVALLPSAGVVTPPPAPVPTARGGMRLRLRGSGQR